MRHPYPIFRRYNNTQSQDGLNVILSTLFMDQQDKPRTLQEALDIMHIFDKPPPNQQEAQVNSISVAQDKSLALEVNNSLAILGQPSIEHGLPIPKNMLSHSEDGFQSQDRQYQQNSPEHPALQMEDVDNVVNTLNLNDLFFDKLDSNTGENTKNVLRNFGNAQNHYVLYHRKAAQYIAANIADRTLFDEWVRSQKLENFENFKSAWTYQEIKLFRRVYKKVCWDFYTENAIPYVLSSRIKKSQTRNSHLRYIYRFLEGLRNPQDFTYFRKQ